MAGRSDLRDMGPTAGRRLVPALLLAAGMVLSAGCARHHGQMPTAGPAFVPSQPPAPASVPAGPVAEVVYWHSPADDRMDGPFDEATGQRVMLQPGPDGQQAVVVDPASGLPLLLPDRARPAPDAVAYRVSLPVTTHLGGS